MFAKVIVKNLVKYTQHKMNTA